MRFISLKLKDGRYTVKDTYYKSLYGAFKTEIEAQKSADDFNTEYERQRRELTECGLMMTD